MSAGMTFACSGAVNAFLAVAAGAFGAHGLRSRLDDRHLAIFETGARYHMFHALGLFAVAWLVSRDAPRASLAGWLMLAGIAIFCGSLYALALTGVGKLGAGFAIVTPLGGLCFLAAWGLLAWSAFSVARA